MVSNTSSLSILILYRHKTSHIYEFNMYLCVPFGRLLRSFTDFTFSHFFGYLHQFQNQPLNIKKDNELARYMMTVNIYCVVHKL